MTRAPSPAAIQAVEARVAQSRRDIGDSLRRATVAFRANLARPSTLIAVAGVAGLVGFWMARRQPRPRAPASASIAGTTSVAGLAGAFILHYVTQQLPFVVRQLRAALEQPSPQPEAHRSELPGAGHGAPRTLH